jgi:hypothetical protein
MVLCFWRSSSKQPEIRTHLKANVIEAETMNNKKAKRAKESKKAQVLLFCFFCCPKP